MNTDASILVYKFRPERTGFKMYAEYTRPQLTFLALHPCIYLYNKIRHSYIYVAHGWPNNRTEWVEICCGYSWVAAGLF